MFNTEYLYVGGPLDGEWRVPPNVPSRPIPEHFSDDGRNITTYAPTKFAQMGDVGELRIVCWVMLAQDLHAVLTNIEHDGPQAVYRKRLERSVLHRVLREHMQRIWRVPEVLEFGPAWLAMESVPVPPRTRPIRDNPQA